MAKGLASALGPLLFSKNMHSQSVLWFIAGAIAGFVSMRAMGWLCLVGLVCLGPLSIHAACPVTFFNESYNPSITFTLSAFYSGSWHGIDTGSAAPGGSTTKDESSFGVSGYEAGINITGCPATVIDLGATWGAICGQTFNIASCSSITNAASSPSYGVNGCITNDANVVEGYYLHTSIPVSPCSGGPAQQDFYSGPLAPGDHYCLCLSNNFPFQVSAEQVLYNSDGGTNTVTVGPPTWAGTNSLPTQGFPGGGGPGGGSGNPGGNPGGGLGSNTNLTGGQFNAGMSNLFGVIINVGNLDAGLLSKIDQDIRNNGTNNQIDYRSYLITLTNQGSAHLTMLQVLTNQGGQLYTQVVQVAALGQTNFAWLTNEHAQLTNAYATVTNNPAFSNAMVNIALGDSNMFMSASAGYDGGIANHTNTGSTSFTGSPWTIPGIYSSVANYHSGISGVNIDPTTSTLWTNLVPWVRLLGYAVILSFAVSYIHSRVQEEIIRLGIVPTPGWSVGGIVSKATGLATMVVTVAALPVLIGVAVGVVTSGASTVSPFSDAGMATGGSYSNYLHLGWGLLNALFPAVFAFNVLVYLFFFDQLCTAAVLAGQRLQKLTQ